MRGREFIKVNKHSSTQRKKNCFAIHHYINNAGFYISVIIYMCVSEHEILFGFIVDHFEMTPFLEKCSFASIT